MPRYIQDRRRFLSTSAAALSLIGTGCVGVIEESTNGGDATWMPREELEGGVWKEDEGWVYEDELLELVNGEVNDRRHDQGLGTLDFDITLKNSLMSEARMDPTEAPNGVEIDEDPFYCRGREAKVHVSVNYESKHDDEDGVLIKADRHTIAEDVVTKMESSAEMQDVLYDPDFESHAARVNIGDHGKVYLPQVFCGPK